METWREEHTNTVSARSAPLLSGFTASEWLRHGIPHRSGLLLGLHRSNSFHFPPSTYPQFRPILFICHVSSLDRGSTHGCPGAQGVEMWRADKRASVDRRLLCLDRGLGGCHGLRVNWSHGRHTVNLSWWYCVGGMHGSIVNLESMHSVICV